MNRNTGHLKNWLGRVRRIIKIAAAATDKTPRWCPASIEGEQLEFDFQASQHGKTEMRANG
jgi:hypothetical protein